MENQSNNQAVDYCQKNRKRQIIITIIFLLVLYVLIVIPIQQEFNRQFNISDVVVLAKFDDNDKASMEIWNVQDHDKEEINTYIIMHDITNDYQFEIIDSDRYNNIKVNDKMKMDKQYIVNPVDNSEKVIYRFLK